MIYSFDVVSEQQQWDPYNIEPVHVHCKSKLRTYSGIFNQYFVILQCLIFWLFLQKFSVWCSEPPTEDHSKMLTIKDNFHDPMPNLLSDRVT